VAQPLDGKQHWGVQLTVEHSDSIVETADVADRDEGLTAADSAGAT
jgi:hypothetical protein